MVFCNGLIILCGTGGIGGVNFEGAEGRGGVGAR
jgi:hypothetical protein